MILQIVQNRCIRERILCLFYCATFSFSYYFAFLENSPASTSKAVVRFEPNELREESATVEEIVRIVTNQAS